MSAMAARDKLIVALDVASADAGAHLAETLGERVGVFKIGSEAFSAEGPVLARYLLAQGRKVFLDLKFHDIPNTVRAAAREVAAMGVHMFNVHALGGRKMLEAALEGAREGAHLARRDKPLVLAVTVLTSLEARDLEELGIEGRPDQAVTRLAQLAQNSGLDGVVASPREIEAIRRVCGPGFVIVTPGIRPPAAASNDQSRIATPEAAIRAGADYLVVGRPITAAPDPAAAAQAIVTEIEQGLVSAARAHQT